METNNDIRLRPRFYKDIEENIDLVRQKFVDYAKQVPPGFLIKIRPNHIQFTIQGEKQHYWSPHLSIELEEKEGNEKNATHIRGLFGPAQTLWTFFVFLHFIIAGIFLVFLMFCYSNYMLHQPIRTAVIVMTLMLACWVLLYFVGRKTRANGYGQMKELEEEFNKIVN
jgi:4-amino-4-deoxy-L-arabinose transferase-like glycosyltransferase